MSDDWVLRLKKLTDCAPASWPQRREPRSSLDDHRSAGHVVPEVGNERLKRDLRRMTHKLNQLTAPGSGASRFAAPKCSFTVLRVARPRGSGRLRRLVRTKCQRRTGRRWHCQGFRTPASCPSCLVGPGLMTSRFQFDGVASRAHHLRLGMITELSRTDGTCHRFVTLLAAGPQFARLGFFIAKRPAPCPPIPPGGGAGRIASEKTVETDCGERPHFRIVRTVRTCPMPAPWGHSNCLRPGWPY